MEEQLVVSRAVYFTVFVALVVLMGLTVGAACLDLGPALNLTVALAIAVAKALLIVLYFMHVRYSAPLMQLFAFIGVLWLAVGAVFHLSDILTRDVLSPLER